ncbi:hypothetical protein OEZ86_008086 [Tetradesmus obliquus]|nr:hypothetical protein OEZ86_008077 [Tetradesmus obliquus]WIA36823.1 hypothetical protein OEZ86_008078 [Tetradesmus obliquus]WIA36824.1 hypothetical protein OEZ86_008079 [Tetradesmus obliquus]WIA36825.1 hypothetical protein OEZ86_008080 [Tetradesmus obliquus]WIA36826.1 hypothetical protein OEZ86_008081 [Tetradesmus obliquus]
MAGSQKVVEGSYGRSRNENFFNNWYANAGNGLGPGPASNFRPPGNPGVCGDPYQEAPASNMANIRGPVTTYRSGQVFRVNVRLQVNHGGRLTFRLCDRRTNLDQACFNARTLVRADNGRPHWYITQGSFESTRNGNPETAEFDLRLPSGFSCPGGCVLQMEYYTYNSCVEPCPREDCGFYADRRNQITNQPGPLDFCRAGGPQEIFLNCADVVINGDGGPTPPGPTPPGGCAKCNLPASQGGCKCDGNCNCLPGTGPTPPGPTPGGGNVCDKCNLPASQGGCKCDANCGCLPGTGPTPPGPTPGGGNVCDKCNLPASQGGCKCDANCGCLPGTGPTPPGPTPPGGPCAKCNLPASQGGCKCNANCACLPQSMSGF